MLVSPDRKMTHLNFNTRLGSLKSALITAVFVWCGFAVQVAAQDLQVVSVEVDGKETPTMSVSRADPLGKAVIDDTSITIESRETWRRFVATTNKGPVYSDWYNTRRFTRWVAFDLETREFRVLAPRLKITSTDYAALDESAKRLGAIRIQVLENLGYAEVWLPKEINPAEIANALKAQAVVQSAEVQFKEPPKVPM